MTHTAPVPESSGTHGEAKPSDCACQKCGKKTVTYTVWEASDGGWEDYKYTCLCGHVWWVDGIDS